MHQFPKNIGWVEVICGSMFSGKTEELIRRIKRALYGKQRVQVFKPGIDTRYDELNVVSHSQLKVVATPVKRAEEILQLLRPDTEVVGIDEVQFLGAEVVAVCEELAGRGLRLKLWRRIFAGGETLTALSLSLSMHFRQMRPE